jgi:hypothetical protein
MPSPALGPQSCDDEAAVACSALGADYSAETEKARNPYPSRMAGADDPGEYGSIRLLAPVGE